jgi:hypothetical protein
MAGLKWPPDTGAQVMMAKTMPNANATPIWKIDPKAVTPMGLSEFRVKLAMAAIPGKT